MPGDDEGAALRVEDLEGESRERSNTKELVRHQEQQLKEVLSNCSEDVSSVLQIVQLP